MFSVIICTYNRAEILNEVLTHLCTSTDLEFVDEIVVIDNNSDDDTRVTVENLCDSCTKLRYVFEKIQGLSFARNRGAKEAIGDYVFYIDDDALADKELFVKAHQILVSNPHIDALGGRYLPWYRYGRPKWFKDEYASKIFSSAGLHKIPSGEYWSGGIMAIKRTLFDRYGYFDTNLGMKGDQVFYGEETEYQMRLNKAGVDVYGDNGLIIHHVVQDYKLSLAWFFKLKANAGRSNAIINSDRNKYFESVKAVFIALGQAVIYSILNLGKLFQKDYHLQNYLIESYTKPYKWFSYSKAVFKRQY